MVWYLETDLGVLGENTVNGLVGKAIAVVPFHDEVRRAFFLGERDKCAVMKAEKVVDSLDYLEIPFAGAVRVCEIVGHDEAAVTHEWEILLQIVADAVIGMD